MKQNLQKNVLCASIACLIWLISGVSRGDARTDYLINMLQNGSNYRIRVQAATTLGKLRSADGVPALVKALHDEHELVVISAATSLGQIGNPSVIPALEKAAKKKPQSPAAKSQIAATLRILKALASGSQAGAAADETPTFFIRVDAMGNSSGVGKTAITEVLRETVLSRVQRESGVVMQESGLSNSQVRKKLKEKKLTGYILSGSLIRMEKVDGKIVVKIGLNVFTNPDYNLLMMPTAEGSVPVSSSSMSREAEHNLQSKAIKAVADRLVGTIFRKLRQMENP